MFLSFFVSLRLCVTLSFIFFVCFACFAVVSCGGVLVVNTEALLAELADIVGGGNVVSAETFAAGLGSVDWPIPPLRVVLPGSVDETASVVRACEAAGAALVVVGGGTQLHTGYAPRRDKPYLWLSTARMNRILDYQPDDMTVTCEPGVTLDTLAHTLAAQRQFLPLDAPLPRRATVGGVVSTNAGGFRRLLYGAARDLVIGVRAVMTGGTQVKGGGKVVKNVAGYDVCKLFTGGWGTAGILTEITFKVYPLPKGQRLLRLAAPDLATAARVGLALHHAQLAPAALLVTNELDENGIGHHEFTQHQVNDGSRDVLFAPCLLALLQGPSDRMNWQAAEIARRGSEAGLGAQEPLPLASLDSLRDWQARSYNDTPVAARIACLLTDMPPLLAELQNLSGSRVTADCALGIVNIAAYESYANFVKTLNAAVPDTANLRWTRLDPALSRDAELHSLLADINVWGDTRETAALQRALKRAIDPKDTFSPGRFVGRI